MPAYQTSSPSSASSFSDSSHWLVSNGSSNISFSDYHEYFESNNNYTDLMVTLFEWQDLIIKTNELKHLAALVEWFQNEIDAQQGYMWEIFDTMEAGGLHNLLKKGIMFERKELLEDNNFVSTYLMMTTNHQLSYDHQLLIC